MKLPSRFDLHSLQKNRGGIWYDYKVGARKANCHPNSASAQFSAVGFRVTGSQR
jgi:hypothetical protein